MSSADFHIMNLREKIRWVYFEGEFITSIRYYQYKINLYLIDQMFVELYYHALDDKIEKIEILDDKSTRMKFYEDQIRLPEI